jgi:hypothetical protein
MTDPNSPTTRRRLLGWLPRILAGGAVTAGVLAATSRDETALAHKAPCVGQGLCAYCASSAACIRPPAQTYRRKAEPTQERRDG